MPLDTASSATPLLLDPEFWSSLESAFTIAAILVGGFWTYRLFIQQRQQFPRARVEHAVQAWEVPGGQLLRITIIVQNQGDVLLRIVCGKVWVSGVRPWPEELQSVIGTTRLRFDHSEREIQWPLLAECEWESGVEEVEPGEQEQLHYDFVLDESWRTLQVYSYLQNASKRRRWKFGKRHSVGWNTTTMHDLEHPDEEGTMPDTRQIGPTETKQAPPKEKPPERPQRREQGPPKEKPVPFVPQDPPKKQEPGRR